MLSKRLVLIVLGLLSQHAISAASAQALPERVAQNSGSGRTPPESVMNKFYGYLGQYNLWLGDDRGACSYDVDPAGVKTDGDDRFFLARISRGRAGTACRGVLDFRIMQVNCKTGKLYAFTREQKEDMRLAGWERYETTLSDPTARSTNGNSKNRSAEAVKAICAL